MKTGWLFQTLAHKRLTEREVRKAKGWAEAEGLRLDLAALRKALPGRGRANAVMRSAVLALMLAAKATGYGVELRLKRGGSAFYEWEE